MLLLALSLATQDAHAGKSEVGTSKTTGIGVNLGYPNAFTAKLYFKPKSGMSVTAGAYPGGLGTAMVRVQYEQVFYTIGNWDWGKLDLYWNAGVGSNVTIVGLNLQPGIGGGVSALLRFKDVPAEVFVDNSIYVYPALFSAAFDTGYVGGLGGRWYF
jgi:hypothetical protein